MTFGGSLKERHLKAEVPFSLHEIDVLGAKDAELQAISHRGGLALNLEEMRAIQAYFKERGRNPTDVELQSLGQAWSEHCCYKSSRFYLREAGIGFLKEHPWPTRGKVLLKGDAGVMEFDDDYAYAVRIESHNHPSTVEPYGGASTGIGGIVRDVLCMGAKPIALVDPLHFGPLDHLYEDLPKEVKHPKYLFSGVVAGIRDYGNRIGVPTVAGGVVFDPGYVGNLVVNVGCVGIAPKGQILRNAVGGPGDLFVLCGGATGRDGIHGVTYASLELDEETAEEWHAGAVQLGDPIMKEPLMHACLEAASRGLLRGMKDLGGGGLSCVVGEMAHAGGCGAEVELEKVPLKEAGLAPWEIWVSESQERMMVAVEPSKLEEVLTIFRLYDVPATPIGLAIQEPVARVFYRGNKVLELDLSFLTRGPEYCRSFDAKAYPKRPAERPPPAPGDLEAMVLQLLASPNIASREWIIRQYDHEVKASTVVKPLQGRIGLASHGDAAVVKPLFHSWRGLAIATASNPFVAAIDPYLGGATVVDEVCRNLVAVGARPDALSDCMNFGNPERPDRMAAFREAARGIADVARELRLAIPSGNVSLYNESPHGPIPPTPVVLGVGLVDDVQRCITSDLKAEGNPLYLLGKTAPEMGGSEYYRLVGASSPQVPGVDAVLLRRSVEGLLDAMAHAWVRSCHDVSHGGLPVALGEMALGGDVGASVDITRLGDLRTDMKLFSESNGRWVVEVERDVVARFEDRLRGLPLHRIGTVGGERLEVIDGSLSLHVDLPRMREAWGQGLAEEVTG